MSNSNKILWEFWQNPYGNNGPEFVEEKDAKIGQDSWNDQEEEKTGEVRPVIPTPMGLMPAYPFKNFPDVFEFWIGHTNFYITKTVKKTIEFTPGVEIFDLFSPYRFRICIGKAFKGSEVKYNIQAALNTLPNSGREINPNSMQLDDETKYKVDKLQSSIKDKFTYWAIYVMPNGEVDVYGSHSKEDYTKKLKIYTDAVEAAGGLIYKYA